MVIVRKSAFLCAPEGNSVNWALFELQNQTPEE